MKLLLIAILCLSANAATITNNTGGTSNGLAAFGQSFTTPNGGPWENIRFNFFRLSQNPLASGTLFLLTSEYLGTPSALSSATPGFLASTATIVSNQWSFTGVTLNPNTQYFALTTSEITIAGSLTNTYAGGALYASNGDANFRAVSSGSRDLNFQVDGDVAQVPEPATNLFTAAGLALIAVERGKPYSSRRTRKFRNQNSDS